MIVTKYGYEMIGLDTIGCNLVLNMSDSKKWEQLNCNPL